MPENEELLTIVYVSAATRLMSDEALEELLAKARERNAQLGITGLLLYRDGNFMQALEGPDAAVSELYASIGRDPRHHHVLTIINEHGGRSEFGDWAMAYGRIDVRRWNEILSRLTPPGEALSTGVAKNILHEFWKTTN